jgi:hypothetical protein
MNLVVNFLSMLNEDEENGGVKRMLGVCSEFERIAKVVLDKAEKETSSRRKRKSHEDPKAKGPLNPADPNQIPMNLINGQCGNPAVFSPSIPNHHVNGLSPMNGSSPGSQWQPDYNNVGEFMTPNGQGMTPFADIQGYTNGNEINSPLNINNFQQPFVPQDLWQMPMTLEWDWADLTGGQYPSFENGLVGDPGIQNNNQNLQNQQMQ